MVITENSQQAERLQQETAFFCGDRISLLEFPDWEILPYDNFSPHQDIISQRLTTLSRIKDASDALLIIPSEHPDAPSGPGQLHKGNESQP